MKQLNENEIASAREHGVWNEAEFELDVHRCPHSECMWCGELACPWGEPLHFDKDGCPACEQEHQDERE
jgi:hypothetical protein